MKTEPYIRIEQGDDGPYDIYVWLYGERYSVTRLDIKQDPPKYMRWPGYTHLMVEDSEPHEVVLGIRYCPVPPPKPSKPKRRMTDLGLRRPR